MRHRYFLYLDKLFIEKEGQGQKKLKLLDLEFFASHLMLGELADYR